MIEKWDITIPELTGDEVRSAYICLPEAYTYDTNRRFPVLYMFDGHNLFFDSHATYGKSWGLKEYMEYTVLFRMEEKQGSLQSGCFPCLRMWEATGIVTLMSESLE